MGSILSEIERFLSEGAEGAHRSARLPDDLTSRELEVLELIAQGLDNAAIAAQLGLTAKTIRTHATNILSKLDVAHRSAAIVFAREAGLGRKGAAAASGRGGEQKLQNPSRPS